MIKNILWHDVKRNNHCKRERKEDLAKKIKSLGRNVKTSKGQGVNEWPLLVGAGCMAGGPQMPPKEYKMYPGRNRI